MRVLRRTPRIADQSSSKRQRHGHAAFASRHREAAYGGLTECAAPGLHAFAFRLFTKYVPPNSNVLDLGSGEGAWAKRLHDASYKVTACDAEARGGRDFPFPYCKADLNADFSDNFPKGEYDAISFIEVAEHLENPRHSFRQIAALLKTGGLDSFSPGKWRCSPMPRTVSARGTLRRLRHGSWRRSLWKTAFQSSNARSTTRLLFPRGR